MKYLSLYISELLFYFAVLIGVIVLFSWIEDPTYLGQLIDACVRAVTK